MIGGEHGLVAKALYTHTCGSGSITAGKRKGSCPSLPDDFSNGSTNRGSLYHCTIWASKRSHKIGKQVGFMDVLANLLEPTSAFILQTYFCK